MPWLFQRPETKKWWVGYRENGQQFRFSTGTSDEEKAKAELARINSMIEAKRAKNLTRRVYESLTGATTTSTIKAESDEWLAECAGATAKGTLARYRGVMADLLEFLKASPHGPLMSEIEDKQVRAYLAYKLTRATASTVNLERKILASFFRRSVNNGTIQVNPVAAVKRFKAKGDEVERRNLTLDEISNAYAKAPDAFWRYMIIGGFYSGLREGDLITLDWRRIDFAKMVLNLGSKGAKKTGKVAIIPLHPRFTLELKAEHDRRGNPTSGPVWPEQAARYKRRNASPFSRQFYIILSKCGLVEKRKKGQKKNGQAAPRQLSPVSFHSLRHSFITSLNSAGGTNLVAKELAGHGSDLVNSVYTHLPLELIQAAIAGMPQLPEVTS